MSKVLFIGAGNMGQAIIAGVLKKSLYSKEDIYIYEINESTKNHVIKSYGVKELPVIDSKISEFEVIILAVKPQTFLSFGKDPVMLKLPDLINSNQTVVSIMAGITISKISSLIGKDIGIVRIMPNTPCLVGEGMSVLAPSENVKTHNLEEVKMIFNSVGLVEVMDEKSLDAVTGLSGSGPAYVFLFIEALTQGGILSGLPKNTAEKLAIQTVSGSLKMIDGTKSVEELRHMVTSPAGTTIEAISVLESKGFKSAVMEAVRAATNRSKELGAK